MSLPVLSGQLLVGLINGSFYAVLSLGLSIIFGLLGIVNLTQGAFYGDDNQSASNFPIVRITDSAGHVVYCRTHNAAGGVATGAKLVSAKFDIPSTIALGSASVVVVANGIPSAAVQVTIN